MLSDIIKSLIRFYQPIVISIFVLFFIGMLYAQSSDTVLPESDATGDTVLTDSVFKEVSDPLVFQSVESPYMTVVTHLANLQKETYRPKISAMTIPGADMKKKIDIAVKIKKILDYEGLYIDVDEIPKNPNYKDTITGRQIYILAKEHPEIYLSLQAGKWLYSKETVKMIPIIFAEYEDLDAFSLQDIIGADWTGEYFGLQAWQWFWLLILLILVSILYFIFYLVLGSVFIRIFNYFSPKNAIAEYMEPVSKPLSIVAVIFIFTKLLPLIGMPVGYNATIIYVAGVLYPLLLTFMAFKLTHLVGDIYAAIASKTATKIDDNLVPLIRRLLKGVVVIVGIFYIIDAFGLDYTPLLAGVSVGGLAIALAAQDTVKNLLGSITIYIDQPFDIGDWIIFESAEGTVEEVGIRSTRIRTFYNSLVSVPNGKIADGKIDNMGKRNYRRYKTTIAITYDTPPDLIEAYVEGLRKLLLDMDSSLKTNYEIHLNEFGANSLDILVYIFFQVDNWTQELESRQEFILESIRLAEELGVRFAFPTSTLFIEDFPGKESKTPVYTETKDEFMNKVSQYMDGRKARLAQPRSNQINRNKIEGDGGE